MNTNGLPLTKYDSYSLDPLSLPPSLLNTNMSPIPNNITTPDIMAPLLKPATLSILPHTAHSVPLLHYSTQQQQQQQQQQATMVLSTEVHGHEYGYGQTQTLPFPLKKEEKDKKDFIQSQSSVTAPLVTSEVTIDDKLERGRDRDMEYSSKTQYYNCLGHEVHIGHDVKHDKHDKYDSVRHNKNDNEHVLHCLQAGKANGDSKAIYTAIQILKQKYFESASNDYNYAFLNHISSFAINILDDNSNLEVKLKVLNLIELISQHCNICFGNDSTDYKILYNEKTIESIVKLLKTYPYDLSMQSTVISTILSISGCHKCRSFYNREIQNLFGKGETIIVLISSLARILERIVQVDGIMHKVCRKAVAEALQSLYYVCYMNKENIKKLAENDGFNILKHCLRDKLNEYTVQEHGCILISEILCHMINTYTLTDIEEIITIINGIVKQQLNEKVIEVARSAIWSLNKITSALFKLIINDDKILHKYENIISINTMSSLNIIIDIIKSCPIMDDPLVKHCLDFFSVLVNGNSLIKNQDGNEINKTMRIVFTLVCGILDASMDINIQAAALSTLHILIKHHGNMCSLRFSHKLLSLVLKIIENSRSLKNNIHKEIFYIHIFGMCVAKYLVANGISEKDENSELNGYSNDILDIISYIIKYLQEEKKDCDILLDDIEKFKNKETFELNLKCKYSCHCSYLHDQCQIQDILNAIISAALCLKQIGIDGINTSDKEGFTLLHRLAHSGLEKWLNLFVEVFDCDIDYLKNTKSGLNTLQLGQNSPNPSCITILKKKIEAAATANSNDEYKSVKNEEGCIDRKITLSDTHDKEIMKYTLSNENINSFIQSNMTDKNYNDDDDRKIGKKVNENDSIGNDSIIYQKNNYNTQESFYRDLKPCINGFNSINMSDKKVKNKEKIFSNCDLKESEIDTLKDTNSYFKIFSYDCVFSKNNKIDNTFALIDDFENISVDSKATTWQTLFKYNQSCINRNRFEEICCNYYNSKLIERFDVHSSFKNNWNSSSPVECQPHISSDMNQSIKNKECNWASINYPQISSLSSSSLSLSSISTSISTLLSSSSSPETTISKTAIATSSPPLPQSHATTTPINKIIYNQSYPDNVSTLQYNKKNDDAGDNSIDKSNENQKYTDLYQKPSMSSSSVMMTSCSQMINLDEKCVSIDNNDYDGGGTDDRQMMSWLPSEITGLLNHSNNSNDYGDNLLNMQNNETCSISHMISNVSEPKEIKSESISKLRNGYFGFSTSENLLSQPYPDNMIPDSFCQVTSINPSYLTTSSNHQQNQIWMSNHMMPGEASTHSTPNMLLNYDGTATNMSSNIVYSNGLGLINTSDATDIPSKHLWLGNLNTKLQKSVLKSVFEAYGPIDDIVTFTGRMYAFVNFLNHEDAQKAAKELDNKEIASLTGNRKLVIKFRPNRKALGRVGDLMPGVNADGTPEKYIDILPRNNIAPHDFDAMMEEEFSLPPEAKPSRRLWLGNICAHPSKTLLFSLFSKYGPVESVRIFPTKTYAFVNFVNVSHSTRAKENLENESIEGVTAKEKKLVIRYQREGASSQTILDKNTPLSGTLQHIPNSNMTSEQLQLQLQKQQNITSIEIDNMNMINNSDMLTMSMLKQNDIKNFVTDPLYDLQRNGICDNNIDPLNLSPSINLSNKLNPNNVHYDIQLAERYKRMSKMQKEALWAQDKYTWNIIDASTNIPYSNTLNMLYGNNVIETSAPDLFCKSVSSVNNEKNEFIQHHRINESNSNYWLPGSDVAINPFMESQHNSKKNSMNYNTYFSAQGHLTNANNQMMKSSPLSTLGEINYINPQEYDIIYDDGRYGQNGMRESYLSSTNLIPNSVCDDDILTNGIDISNCDGVSKLLTNHNSLCAISDGNKDKLNYYPKGCLQPSLPLYSHYHYQIDSNISNGMPLEQSKIADHENKSIPVNSSHLHAMQPDSMCHNISTDTTNIQKISENSFSYSSTANLQKNIW